MKRFLLFVNRRKERADEKAKAIREQLLRLGAMRVDIEDQSTQGITALDYDCVITLGGDGTLIRFFDPGHLMLPAMKDFLLTTAEEAGIKYQYYCGKGGTDAGAAHLQSGGVPSTTIGVCARYIHSHQTLYAMDDFLQAQAFLQALVKKLDRSTVDTITNY